MTGARDDDGNHGKPPGGKPPGGKPPGADPQPQGGHPNMTSAPSGTTKQQGTTFALLPRFDTSALMPETSGKMLDNLRSQIAQLTLEQEGSGIRHEGGRYLYLEAGNPEAPLTCELHVGRDPLLRDGSYAHKVTLAWREEQCFLYIDVAL